MVLTLIVTMHKTNIQGFCIFACVIMLLIFPAIINEPKKSRTIGSPMQTVNTLTAPQKYWLKKFPEKEMGSVSYFYLQIRKETVRAKPFANTTAEMDKSETEVHIYHLYIYSGHTGININIYTQT